MRTFEEHCQQVAENKGYSSFNNLVKDSDYHNDAFRIMHEAAHELAKEVAQDALNRSAESVYAMLDFEGMRQIAVVDKESITSTEIILP